MQKSQQGMQPLLHKIIKPRFHVLIYAKILLKSYCAIWNTYCNLVSAYDIVILNDHVRIVRRENDVNVPFERHNLPVTTQRDHFIILCWDC